jgi:hypothetical protein
LRYISHVLADQRRVQRIPVDLPARYRSETSSVDGRAEDISQDGMRFVGRAGDVAPGALHLEIDLPDSDETPLTLRGEIAWITSGPLARLATIGIRFTGIEKLVRRRLANFVIRRACKTS